MLELIQVLERETGIEDIEFVSTDANEFELLFTGFNEYDEEIEIIVNKCNEVYINNELQDIYLPMNVWSIEL